MGWLVAPSGHVETIEIIPELVTGARRAIQRAGVSNVDVLLDDGSLGPRGDERLFDRAVFTAGASGLPKAFLGRVKRGGLLPFVLAIPGGGSVLSLFERVEFGLEHRVGSA